MWIVIILVITEIPKLVPLDKIRLHIKFDLAILFGIKKDPYLFLSQAQWIHSIIVAS